MAKNFNDKSELKERSLEERLGLQDSRWKEPEKKEVVKCPCETAKPGQAIEVVFETDNYADSKHSVVVKCAKCFTKLPRPKEIGLREKLIDALNQTISRRDGTFNSSMAWRAAMPGILADIAIYIIKEHEANN